jgi:hypothetical protein
LFRAARCPKTVGKYDLRPEIAANKAVRAGTFAAVPTGIPNASNELGALNQMNTKMNSSLKVKTALKACGIGGNHSRKLATAATGLKVKTALKACGIGGNHSRVLVSR